MEDNTPQVKYNPGLDVALEVSKIIKRCEYFCRNELFRDWLLELEILRRRLSAKYNKNQTDSSEILNAKDKGLKIINTYIDEYSKGHLSYRTQNSMYTFLCEYEETLRKFASKYGYDNPDKADASKAMLER